MTTSVVCDSPLRNWLFRDAHWRYIAIFDLPIPPLRYPVFGRIQLLAEVTGMPCAVNCIFVKTIIEQCCDRTEALKNTIPLTGHICSSDEISGKHSILDTPVQHLRH